MPRYDANVGIGALDQQVVVLRDGVPIRAGIGARIGGGQPQPAMLALIFGLLLSALLQAAISGKRFYSGKTLVAFEEAVAKIAAAADARRDPDFVINAGGVLHGGGLEEQGWTREVLDARLAGIGDAVYGILQLAKQKGISTDAAARQIARSRLDGA